MRKTLLIFGASGFVGSHLAAEFYNNGYDIYGADIKKSDSVPEYVKFEKCDLIDCNAVERLIETVNPTHIVNLAAVSSVGQSWEMPQTTVKINVVGALNILEAVRKHCKTAKTLLIGSSEEYRPSENAISEDAELNSTNPYGISKIMQEQFAELYRCKYDMEIFYVRAFNHIGPGQTDRFVISSWCKQAAEISKGIRETIMNVGNVYVKRDFTDVRDVVCAYRMIMEKGDCNKVYNVGSGKTICLTDILNHIISLTNKEIKIIVDESLVRKNENHIICCDTSFIEKEIGWSCKYDIFDTITEIYNKYMLS